MAGQGTRRLLRVSPLINKCLWSVFPPLSMEMEVGASFPFYFFNCLQILMLPFV